MTISPTRTRASSLKDYQRSAWSGGDYTSVAGTTTIASELLVERLDVRPGERVLDAACGSGNATIACARRFADVTGLDFSATMLKDAGRRLAAERVSAELIEADIENIPLPDSGFDVVVSAFGAMFAPDQKRTAAELLRVCRPGGRIGLACWTAVGSLGGLFDIMSRYIPPTPGTPQPTAWGDPSQLRELFGDGIDELGATRREFVFRYRSPQHWLEHFKTNFGPTSMVFSVLPPRQSAALERDLIDMWRSWNRASDGTLVAPVEYLEAVLIKKP
ncbi:class I SAM-dependent methyltransferase [Nonomuraea endophytica]|uniref:SAM-dependent methyltransferase n=1 Tax=Nonomuraea endophytica TaxID=714136 RepID=A0A7W8AF40_9ACTN|nr:class I SAM-dependent methyltransferase [Nonomuraea endophytica]MBB5083628.1 SAM-dependent methyltransferase [Nonomuraea endophytica]